MSSSPALSNTLRNNQVQQVLDRLHSSARADKYKFMSFIPRFLWGTLQGKSAGEILTRNWQKIFICLFAEPRVTLCIKQQERLEQKGLLSLAHHLAFQLSI